MRLCDRLLFDGGRPWIGAQAQGEVLEIGVGTGRNLMHYRSGVRITGIDISPGMLRIARRRARALGREVELLAEDAQALEFSDQRFDTVVFSLVLCSVPDPRRAVREAVRVLRPGGRVIMLEHVRSGVPAVRLVQQLIDPVSVRLQGDHLMREPLDDLVTAGLAVERVTRTRWGIVEQTLARKS